MSTPSGLRTLLLGLSLAAVGTTWPDESLAQPADAATVPAAALAQAPALPAAPPAEVSAAGPEGPALRAAPPARQAAPRAVNAMQRTLIDQETRAYCEHVRAARSSEGARLRSPWLAARGSTLQRRELAVQDASQVNLRLRTGLGFSPSDYYRAGLLDDMAAQECEVFRTQSAVRQEGASVSALEREGWQRKADALKQSIADGDRFIAHSQNELAQGNRTIQEHLRVLGDFQRLHSAFSEALSRSAELAVKRVPDKLDAQAFQRVSQSVGALEEAEGAVRRSRSIGLMLEAGYDEIFGAEQELPVYGQVSLTVRPGYFWQRSEDRRSRAARASAAAANARSQQVALQLSVAQVEASYGALQMESDRLGHLLTTLRQEQETLAKIASADAQRLAERLWFEVQLQSANQVQAATTLSAMKAWLTGKQPQPMRLRSGSTSPAQPK